MPNIESNVILNLKAADTDLTHTGRYVTLETELSEDRSTKSASSYEKWDVIKHKYQLISGQDDAKQNSRKSGVKAPELAVHKGGSKGVKVVLRNGEEVAWEPSSVQHQHQHIRSRQKASTKAAAAPARLRGNLGNTGPQSKFVKPFAGDPKKDAPVATVKKCAPHEKIGPTPVKRGILTKETAPPPKTKEVCCVFYASPVWWW
jgi:hypothetical protein